ncbi:hypothetical protein [Clostridium saccharoperbutylacetonicum]|uniref:hypothetical protein n=1 Tax=Clostridium saccharoperbutylacetonicum TaxID=36745 RepID=UPI0039E7FFF7
MNKQLIILGTIGLITIVGAGAGGAILAANNDFNTNTVSKNVEASKEPKQEKVNLSGWKSEIGSWYFYKDNEKQKNWIQDKNSWYYLGADGKMRVGWIKDNNVWYYLNNDGTMATNTTVDNCYINEKGTIEETPANSQNSAKTDDSSNTTRSKYAVTTFEQAKQIVLREDGAYIKKLANPGNYIQFTPLKEDPPGDYSNSWGFPNEDFFTLPIDEYSNGVLGDEYGAYLVGKETGNVYIIPHQGCFSAYQIKNNKVAKEFRWLGQNESPYHNWRK